MMKLVVSAFIALLQYFLVLGHQVVPHYISFKWNSIKNRIRSIISFRLASTTMGNKDDDQEEQQRRRELPEDVICEILTRVPLLSLATQCRLVCVEWEKYLHQPHFQKLHSQRVEPISGFFVQTQRRGCEFYKTYVSANNNPRSTSTDSTLLADSFRLSEKKKIVSSSNAGGLLCCVDYSKRPTSRYYVCRPAKGECKSIPNPKTKFIDRKIMIFPSRFNPLNYKIVRFSHHFGQPYHCEIFDSDKWAWKQYHDVQLPDDDFLDPSEQPGVFLNGFVHCLTSNGMMLVFNVEDGSWRTIGLPIQQNMEQRGIKKMLVQHKGSVAVVLLDNNYCLEIWVLAAVEIYGQDADEQNDMLVWKMEDRVVLSDDLQGFSILDFNSDKQVMLMSSYGSIAWYNLKSNTYTRQKMGCSVSGSTFHIFQADINCCL